MSFAPVQSAARLYGACGPRAPHSNARRWDNAARITDSAADWRLGNQSVRPFGARGLATTRLAKRQVVCQTTSIKTRFWERCSGDRRHCCSKRRLSQGLRKSRFMMAPPRNEPSCRFRLRRPADQPARRGRRADRRKICSFRDLGTEKGARSKLPTERGRTFGGARRATDRSLHPAASRHGRRRRNLKFV